MCCVTSFAEVWIEIGIVLCGASHQGVTSFAEVWIEMLPNQQTGCYRKSHFLRGSVD